MSQVVVEKSWSLKEFAKNFTGLKLAKNSTVDENTGEIKSFNSLAFIDKDNKITFCHFGRSTEGMTVKEIQQDADNLNVGLNSSGKYTLYKASTWEDIVL